MGHVLRGHAPAGSHLTSGYIGLDGLFVATPPRPIYYQYDWKVFVVHCDKHYRANSDARHCLVSRDGMLADGFKKEHK